MLENTINVFDVIEIKKEALHNQKSATGCAIVNVIIPSNIIYIGENAFTDNTALTNIILLADTIYFDNGGSSVKEYPFYNTSSTIYYKNYISLGEDSSNKAYYAFNNKGSSSSDISSTDSSNLNSYTTTWLYINTAVSSLISGNYDIDGYSADDIKSDIIEALQSFAGDDIVYYQNGDYIFIAAGISSVSDASGSVCLTDYIASYVTDCIESYTSGSLSYINGHTVEVETDESDGNNIIVNIADNKTDGNSTAYYRISEDIQLWDSETEEYGSWAASSVSYSEITTENGTSAIDVTYTIDGATLYAAYSAAEGSFEIYGDALYIKNGTTLTITADNYSYALAGLTYNGTAGTADEVTSGQSCSVTTADGAYTLTVEWNAVDKGSNTVTVYSDIAFTLGDNTATRKWQQKLNKKIKI